MILHITNEEKFINGAYDLFEKYYPNKNIFIIRIPKDGKPQTNYIQLKDRMMYLSISKRKDINFIINYAKSKKVKYLFIHYLDFTKASIAILLKKRISLKIYWVFYGSDLYGYLNSIGKYQLLDNDSSTKRMNFKGMLANLFLFGQLPNKSYNTFINQLDFFCFWNEYDFLLLKNHFETSAKHKNFIYFDLIDRKNSFNNEKKVGKVLINHSASSNGNHKTILDKLKSIDNKRLLTEIIAPLSYGNKEVELSIVKYGELLFGERFKPLLTFLRIDIYNRLLDDVSVAIFGQRRQEAAGNIFYLLKVGVKVFLRNDNNMLYWLRDRSFYIYSFEDDLQSSADLIPLTKNQMIFNNTIHNKIFSEQIEKKTMTNLL